VHRLGGLRIERQRELLAPVEPEARLGQLPIAGRRPAVAAREVGRVGGDAIGDQPLLDVVGVRQAEVLLGRHVTEHRRAVPADDRRADRRGDVVVARRDVGHERSEGVEGRLVADPLLLADVHLELVQRDVAGPLHHHLGVRSSANWAASDASAIEPGRRPSPSEIVTSCARQISRTSSKRS